jgi:hypothetical protein
VLVAVLPLILIPWVGCGRPDWAVGSVDCSVHKPTKGVYGFKHSGSPRPVCVCGVCGSSGEVDPKVGLAVEVVEQCNPKVVDSAY